jgi:putative ABC transport system ATP-binding protein
MSGSHGAAISACHVSKTYVSGATVIRALEDVSLDVHAGEIVFLAGPSGSGKTTLLSVMGCLMRPTGGSVFVQGNEVTGRTEKQLPTVRLHYIGFVFQAFNLFPNLTAGENVELTLDLKGIRGAQARRRAGELLEMVGLGELYRRFPEDLSGGQKQRVAIARALAADPPIVLADEPTAALDSESGGVVIGLLRNLAHAHGRAVVVVTHDTRIMDQADRIVRIEDGRILPGPVSALSAGSHDAMAQAARPPDLVLGSCGRTPGGGNGSLSTR